jgi:radical SAM superfamily enzyme YgiQ (UPF0313 family)
MARSGCFAVTIGFESLNRDNLELMRKGWNLKHGDYETAIRELCDRGIMIYASFIFGYDHDTVDTFDAIAEFAIRSRFALVNLIPLNPMPGTKLYSRLQDESRLIFERWWLDPSYRFGQASFRPHQMTPEELAEGCLRAKEAFYGYRSMLMRSAHLMRSTRSIYRLGFFLVVNLAARHALSRKIGHRLGTDTPL